MSKLLMLVRTLIVAFAVLSLSTQAVAASAAQSLIRQYDKQVYSAGKGFVTKEVALAKKLGTNISKLQKQKATDADIKAAFDSAMVTLKNDFGGFVSNLQTMTNTALAKANALRASAAAAGNDRAESDAQDAIDELESNLQDLDDGLSMINDLIDELRDQMNSAPTAAAGAKAVAANLKARLQELL